jgi:hypothetical protein
MFSPLFSARFIIRPVDLLHDTFYHENFFLGGGLQLPTWLDVKFNIQLFFFKRTKQIHNLFFWWQVVSCVVSHLALVYLFEYIFAACKIKFFIFFRVEFIIFKRVKGGVFF